MIFERSVTDSVFMVDCVPVHTLLGAPSFAGQSIPLYVHDKLENTSIAATRQQKTNDGFHHVFTTDEIAESSLVSNKTGEISSQFPLYILQPGEGRRANFDESMLRELFSDVEQPGDSAPSVWPEDILDYIYASLHSPSYRKKYKEFLKTGFPRVSRPKSWSEFWRLAKLGRELRKLHLMKSSSIDDFATTYPKQGGNIVEVLRYEDGKVYINTIQYFGNVPEAAWDFYIGGYQPAQKWLKDRKGQTLSHNDIEHYQRIIKILLETNRIMKQIG
jgi:predicted helicase